MIRKSDKVYRMTDTFSTMLKLRLYQQTSTILLVTVYLVSSRVFKLSCQVKKGIFLGALIESGVLTSLLIFWVGSHSKSVSSTIYYLSKFLC